MNGIQERVADTPTEMTSARSDGDVVDATLAASGDAHAFERLYRSHSTKIYNLARRMVGPDEADELTQDVFVRAWQKLHTFRGDAAFSTWLHRLAVNVMIGRRQALGKARTRFTENDKPLERMSGGKSHSEFYLDFDVAITHLPPGAKEVFILHDIEGFKHHEIATMLGVSTGTSKAQLHRARRTLRKHLDR